MTCRLAFRRYRLAFRTPVRTAHGPWSERDGLILRLDAESGAVGWGEAAPLAGFRTETAEEAAAACESLGGEVTEEVVGRLPDRLVCLRAALRTALSEMAADPQRWPATSGRGIFDLPVAALLPAGKPALAEVRAKADAGFTTFKWKVAVGDARDEIVLLDDLCAALPTGARLRLDANGGWDRRRAELWLDRCADRPIEYIEQPIACDARGAEDLLLGLAGDFPTPVALDESLGGDADVAHWLESGWKGVFVLKPSLLGGGGAALARLAAANASVVFSSAMETAVGARAALRTAFAWAGEPRALGFGVWPLFADSRYDGPAAAPVLRREVVERIDPLPLWTALS